MTKKLNPHRQTPCALCKVHYPKSSLTREGICLMCYPTVVNP